MSGFGFGYGFRRAPRFALSDGSTPAPSPAPTPAPAFTTQPSISPSSGTAGETTFTANDGAASNATGYTRRWLLNGTAIGTGTTVLSASDGSLVLEVTATGPTAPPAVATSAAVTVAAAPAPTPTPTPTPTEVTRLATRSFAPNHNGSSGRSTFSGSTQPSYTRTYTNLSGKPITNAGLVFTGVYPVASPNNFVSLGNDVSWTATIALSSAPGTILSTVSGTTPNGDSIRVEMPPLSAPIPAGASFQVVVTAVGLASGQAYFSANTEPLTNWPLGLIGVTTTTLDDEALVKLVPMVNGDSIWTNNGSAFSAAAGNLNRPMVQVSIIGTSAWQYAPTYEIMAKMAQDAGCTAIATNWGTNDVGATGFSVLRDNLTILKTKANARGLDFILATMTPRVVVPAVPLSAVSSSGTTMTATVPDGSLFTISNLYTITGANEAGYNGDWTLTGRSGNVLTFLFAGAASPTATGTITIKPRAVTSTNPTAVAGLQQPFNSDFAFGTGSPRALHNDWIRTPGNVDDYIDTADALEPSRGAGRFRVAGETPFLLGSYPGTVTSLVSATRYSTDNQLPTGTQGSGRIQWTSGPNLGLTQGITTGGYATVSAAPPVAVAVGHQLIGHPSAFTSASEDGLHLVSSGGSNGAYGGQAILVAAIQAYLASHP